MAIDPRAGQPAEARDLIDVAALIDAYASLRPDPSVAAQRVTFGTSGHRGSSFSRSFNEWHVLAITQAICEHRLRAGVTGPLFLGIDTHALSVPAFRSALEVLAANDVDVLVAADDEYTPTPAVSHAILVYNRLRPAALADGIVVTPSHNPPGDGGFKYNPANGGPADKDVTGWIETRANALMRDELRDVRRIPFERARRASTTHAHDFASSYIDDLASIIDVDVIRGARLRMGVDPLGGAGVHYWGRIAERYGLDLTVVNEDVDPTFRFMTLDWDGRIRMDPSSPYAMQRMLAIKDRFDIAFACDTDHDRHGIVTPSRRIAAAQSLSRRVDRLSVPPSPAVAQRRGGRQDDRQQRDDRPRRQGAGAQAVRDAGRVQMVRRRTARRQHRVRRRGERRRHVPAPGRHRVDDRQGRHRPGLLAGEMLARTGRDPGELYGDLTITLGAPLNDRVDAAATPAQKSRLAQLSATTIPLDRLAGEPVLQILDRAPANDAPIGGVKVVSADGWFAARPSGTENIYKIYAESFRDEDALKQILVEAQTIVDAAIADPR